MASIQKGNCYICGAELGKTAMKNHILKEHAQSGDQLCRLIRVEGAEDKDYWLYLDMPMTATLASLDRFLRQIWLECCGHLSEFSGPGYTQVGKGRKVGAFEKGDKLRHDYDFGSTTELIVTFMDTVYRPAQRNHVRLLARNVPPRFACGKCGKLAKYIDVEAMYNVDNPFLCEDCAEDNDMCLPVTNSPRMGVCGYCGEQDTYDFKLWDVKK